jgi:predicted phage tail protein
MLIMLYGALGKKYGKVHKYQVASVAEAIQALIHTVPGFKKDLAEGSFKILRGGKDPVVIDTIHHPQSTKESIRIVPVLDGAGGGGIGSIILGAVLIFATGPMGLGLWGAGAATTGFAAFAGKVAFSFGVSLIVGGISQLLFSPPDVKTDSRDPVENRPSYSFNGAVNSIAQGNPVPVCYGRLRVGSQVISAALTTEEIPVTY